MMATTPVKFGVFGPFSNPFLFFFSEYAYPVLMVWSLIKFVSYRGMMKRIENRSPVEQLDTAITNKKVSEFVINRKVNEIQNKEDTI